MSTLKTMLKGLLVLSLFVALTACGGTPVTFDQLPLPSDAKEATTTDAVVTSMQDSMKQSMGDKVSKFEVKTYTMPKDSQWPTVQGFYTHQLKMGDWKAEDQLSLDSELIKMQGWTRGSLASEQALIVGYYPNPLDNEIYLMVMLASE
ncbi:MAG: hypothetical protein MUD01_08170 [Chloroflexaceae bacterium]|nr:hypothetical protein [Chloroflexaceae bacterium]